MRITFVISTMSSGGAERVAAILCNTWVRAGETVNLVLFESSANKQFYSLDKEINIRRLDIMGNSDNFIAGIWNNLIRVIKIRTALKETGPDVVISFMTEANILTLLGSLFCSYPVIISERIHPAYHKTGWIYDVLRKIFYPLSSRLVVQTTSINKWFEKNLAIQPVVIANPVEPVFVKTNRSNVNSRRKILAAGRLEYQKGFDLLIKAFLKISDKHTDWDLHIYGEGSQKNNLISIIQSENAFDRIKLCGKSRKLVGEMWKFDLFVLSSRYEGFPNILCEAMANGVACVSFDCESGPSDIIQHEVNGYLVKAGNIDLLAYGMDYLISKPELRLEYGNAARNSMNKYFPEVIVDKWNKILTEAIDRE